MDVSNVLNLDGQDFEKVGKEQVFKSIRSFLTEKTKKSGNASYIELHFATGVTVKVGELVNSEPVQREELIFKDFLVQSTLSLAPDPGSRLQMSKFVKSGFLDEPIRTAEAETIAAFNRLLDDTKTDFDKSTLFIWVVIDPAKIHFYLCAPWGSAESFKNIIRIINPDDFYKSPEPAPEAFDETGGELAAPGKEDEEE